MTATSTLAAWLCAAGAGAALVGAAGAAAAAWPPADAPAPAPAAAAAAAAAAAVPAATVTAGASSTITAAAGRTPEKGTAADLAGWACAAGPTTWIAADSSYSTTPGTAATVTVTTVRPGSGASTVEGWRTALHGCPGTVTDTDTGLLWQSGSRALALTRHADTIIYTAAAGTSAAGLAQTLTGHADTWAGSALNQVCANPADTTDGTSRNPAAATYTGHTDSSAVTAAVPGLPEAALTGAEVSPVRSWAAPTPSPQPGLAAYGTIPALTDPAAVPSPSAAEPTVDPGPRPGQPEPAPPATTITFPAADPVGPGCGWAWIGASAPAFDAAAGAVAERQAWLAGASSVAASQTDWLVAQAAWPNKVRSWSHAAGLWADWQAWYTAKADAEQRWDAATALRNRWLASLAKPSPTPPPSRTSSPSAVPLPEATYTPVPQPTLTAPPSAVPLPLETTPAPVPTSAPPTQAPEPTLTPDPTPTPTATPDPTPTTSPTATSSPAQGTATTPAQVGP